MLFWILKFSPVTYSTWKTFHTQNEDFTFLFQTYFHTLYCSVHSVTVQCPFTETESADIFLCRKDIFSTCSVPVFSMSLPWVLILFHTLNTLAGPHFTDDIFFCLFWLPYNLLNTIRTKSFLFKDILFFLLYVYMNVCTCEQVSTEVIRGCLFPWRRSLKTWATDICAGNQTQFSWRA